MAAEDQHDSEWDGTRYPREKNTGVILGLDWTQVIFLVIFGIGVSATLVFSLGFPVGLFLGLVNVVIAALLGIPRIWGRSLIQWLVETIRFAIRGSKGQLRFIRQVPVFSTSTDREEWDEDPGNQPGRDKHGRIIPGPGYRFNLPGEHAELKVYDLPGGAGFIYDPKRREGIVVAKIETQRALTLESDEALEERIRGFRHSISALSGVAGVARVQMSDQTTIVSGNRVRTWYDQKRAEAPKIESPDGDGPIPLSGDNINAWHHASYLDYIAAAEDQPQHELWLSIVLDAAKLERRALTAGGGLRGFMEVCLGVMNSIEQIVTSSGVRVSGWHSPRSVAALARTAFDPDSSLDISDRDGDWEGAHPESAGPTGAIVGPNYFWSDGWHHRTFMVSEWPQAQARLGFLDELVFAGRFRHTVTVVIKPKDLKASLRKVQQRKADWRTARNLRQKLDRPESLEHEQEIEDIETEELDLMQNYAPVDMVGLVTVSGVNEEELESHSDDVKAKAAQANLELRPAFLQQDSAFAAAALPFGRSILT